MNKLIIGDTEFELEEYGMSNAASTPAVQINGKCYIGKAIPNTPKEKRSTYEVIAYEFCRRIYKKNYFGEWATSFDAPIHHILLHPDEMKNIHSVKRLSDGEVFAIDEINEQGKITKFNLIGNSILVSVLCRDQYEYFLEDLIKKKHKYYEIISIDDGNSLVHDVVAINNFKNGDNRYTDFSIRSVKRLSDGTVLSHGDSITWVTRQDIPVDTIKRIEWQLGQNKPFFHLESGGGCYGDYLKKVKKEKPISYEILEIISHGDEVRKLIDGLYRFIEDGVGFELGYLLNRTDTSIKTVKRLADGEIFTIGDKVERMDDNDTIDAFLLNYKGNDIWVSTDVRNGYGSSLECAKKAKEVILTTEDGVDLYEGDNVWFVRPDFTFDSVTISLKPSRITYKYFSTREAADNYVLMNRSCLSVQDIIDAYYLKALEKDNLIELAKKKLNVK